MLIRFLVVEKRLIAQVFCIRTINANYTSITLEILMPQAFVLINVESGSEEEVVSELKKINGVVEAYFSYGVYDIIAKVKAESMEKLKEMVTHKIRALTKVRSTLTLIMMEE
jgi:DNA-binding Lrp family transcriptional regulator